MAYLLKSLTCALLLVGLLSNCSVEQDSVQDSPVQPIPAVSPGTWTSGDCWHEPDWRPNHHQNGDIHVIGVESGHVTVFILGFNDGDDGETYELKTRECQGRDCSLWTPKVGEEYGATIIHRAQVTPSCIATPTGFRANTSGEVLPEHRTLLLRSNRPGAMLKSSPEYQGFAFPEVEILYVLYGATPLWSNTDRLSSGYVQSSVEQN